MNAQIVTTENEEGGSVTLLINGEEITAMDCLGYGTSSQPYPEQGQKFEPQFTCLFDDEESWNSIFEGNEEQQIGLKPRGGWSYRAFGKVLSVDSADSEAAIDCGLCTLPAPVEITDPNQVGQFIAFNVERLSVWRA
jgi:hypothetical protein